MELLGTNIIFSKGVMEIGLRLMNTPSGNSGQMQYKQNINTTTICSH